MAQLPAAEIAARAKALRLVLLDVDGVLTDGGLTISADGIETKRFDIKDLATLTDWNKILEKEGLIPRIHEWARKLTPNVIWALYRTATKQGKAADVKAWIEIVEGM